MAKYIRKKIIMCINNLERGGAEKQFLYIYHYLKKYYEIKIFLINKKGTENLNSEIKKKIKIGYLNYFFHIYKRQPDISLFFLPKSYICFGIISLIFPRLKKIMFRRSLNYYQSNIFIKYLEFFLHKSMNFICSNSLAAKKELFEKEGVPKKKIFILNNYIDKKKFKFNKNFKVNKSSINLLCISNFIDYKGHRLILETFKYLKNKFNWNIYFLGKKSNFDFSLIKKISKEFKFEKKVFHINKLSSNLKYPNFKYGLLFSENESFPNAIMEYLKLNLDVIAYNTGDIKKLIQNEGLIFKTRNPKLIAQQLEMYFIKKRKEIKTLKLKKIIKPYQNKKIFLILKNKIDSLCVD